MGLLAWAFLRGPSCMGLRVWAYLRGPPVETRVHHARSCALGGGDHIVSTWFFIGEKLGVVEMGARGRDVGEDAPWLANTCHSVLGSISQTPMRTHAPL